MKRPSPTADVAFWVTAVHAHTTAPFTPPTPLHLTPNSRRGGGTCRVPQCHTLADAGEQKNKGTSFVLLLHAHTHTHTDSCSDCRSSPAKNTEHIFNFHPDDNKNNNNYDNKTHWLFILSLIEIFQCQFQLPSSSLCLSLLKLPLVGRPTG